jgi:hypothetical protein
MDDRGSRVLGVFGLLVVAGLVFLWNKAPDFYRGDNAAAASATTRAGILTAAAGLIAFTGVMVNVAETRRANEQTRERDRRAHELDRQGHLTERFGRAADQIGSEQAAVRLAGVYAMAKLADDWAEERQTCIDVLCAYLRMPYTPPPLTPSGRRTSGCHPNSATN